MPNMPMKNSSPWMKMGALAGPDIQMLKDQLMLKQANQLGALSGPDMQYLQSMQQDPAKLKEMMEAGMLTGSDMNMLRSRGGR
jgi:hypothetical protein